MTEQPDQDPEVYKVIGAPGTGKTTRVVGNTELEDHTSLVQQNLEEYPFEDQMIVTYTKAGTEEAAERLSNLIDMPKYKVDDRVRTIHSVCFNLLGLSRDDVINWYDKKSFCDIYDLEFTSDNDEDDIMGSDKAEGNSFFDIYGWLKSNRMDVDQHEECPQKWEGDASFLFLAERWEQYKNESGKLEFHDMIERVVEQGKEQLENLGWGVLFPDEDTTAEEMFKEARTDPDRDPEVIRGKGGFIDTRVLYVDEVQDLTPLQWAWYLMQKLVCEKVYIGGDDDQTIYGWAGANPNFMLDEEGDFEVLDKTYRIPENVWETCDGVIRQVDKRQEKEVEPHGDGGEVVTLERPSPRQVLKHAQEGSVFILFRARYMIDEFAKKMQKHGIPYTNMSTFETWSDDIVKIRDALAKIENGADKISGDELQVLMDYAEDHMVNDSAGFDASERAMGNFSGVQVDRVKEVLSLSTTYGSSELTANAYLSACDELNYYETMAIRENINKGNEDMDPDRVRIGTIHSSKGKEAETVILALDSTQTILANMEEDTANKPDKKISDAERRVYYVGMTRASEKLVLAEGIQDPTTTIRLKDLLDDYEPEYGRNQQEIGSSADW